MPEWPAGKILMCAALSYTDRVDELRNVYISQITSIVELSGWGQLPDHIQVDAIFNGDGLHSGGGSADINNITECMQSHIEIVLHKYPC